MRVNLKRIIPLLAIIGLMACNENSKPNSENSSLDSQSSDLKSENTHISKEFNWNIINSEKDEPYFDTYSLIQFTYQGKEYRMDTLNSHVSPCDLVDSAIEETADKVVVGDKRKTPSKRRKQMASINIFGHTGTARQELGKQAAVWRLDRTQ